jgi:hypothetical protein
VGLRAEAPKTPARGTFGGKAIAPRSVHAVLHRRPATSDEAIDAALHRAEASLADIWSLEFFADPHVPCPPPGAASDGAAKPTLRVDGIGGTARERPFAGTTQPADAVLLGPDGDYLSTWPAWVRFDALSWTAGTKVKGALWTESPPDADRPDHEGSFGGRFEALVCAP